MSEILPWLWIGPDTAVSGWPGQYDAILNVAHIDCLHPSSFIGQKTDDGVVSGSLHHGDKDKDQDTLQCLYLGLPIDDRVVFPLTEWFPKAFDFIAREEAAGSRLLVHCRQGQSRSVSVVLAYLIVRKRWTLKKALHFVHSRRPQAFPNMGFFQLLRQCERDTLGVESLPLDQTHYIAYMINLGRKKSSQESSKEWGQCRIC